jgi:hypothetical protein
MRDDVEIVESEWRGFCECNSTTNILSGQDATACDDYLSLNRGIA